MKTFKITVLVLIISVLFLTGCGNKKEETVSAITAAPYVQETIPIIDETKEEETPNLAVDLTEKLDEDYDIPQKLRDALDQYEEFVDTYCEFMATYANASTDWQLANMDTYVKYNQTITKCQTAINDTLDRKDELTDDEYDYIILVQTRTAAKLLDAASNMMGE